MRIFILFLLLFQSITLKAQEIDSLLNVSLFKNKLHKIDHLNELSFLYLVDKNEIDSCIYYAKEAYEKALTINYKKGEADSHVRLGLAHEDLQQYRIALKKYRKGEAIRTKLNDNVGVANVLVNIGNIYTEINDYPKRLKAYQKALSIQEKLNDSLEIAYINLDVGESFRLLLQHEKAIRYIAKGQEFFYLLNHTEGIGISQLNMAQIHIEKHQYKNALKNLEQALVNLHHDTFYLIKIKNTLGNLYYSQKNFQLALIYYFESMRLHNTPSFYPKQLSNTLSNIGLCYERTGNKNEAFQYYEKSLSIRQKNNYTSDIINSYKNIGHLYSNQKEYSKALLFLRKSYYRSKINDYKNLQLESSIYLADIFSQKQNADSAAHYFLVYNVLKDSILKNEQQTIELLTRQESRIERLKIETKLAKKEQANQAMQTTLSLGLFSFLTLIGALSFWIWRERQKKLLAKQNEEIAKQNELIANQEITTILKEQENKSIKARFEGRERERQRISKDLHDRIGSMLTTVKLYYLTAEEKLDQIKLEAAEYYQKANMLLDETCDEVRRISHNLSSNVLEEFGLANALNSLCERLSGTGKIKIEFIEVELADLKLEQQIELELYRITQELLSNVIKHSEAKEVSVQLSYYEEENALNLIVEDDGKGFDTSNYKAGIGLSNIKLGVQSLDGVIEIDSGKGAGTTINIEIPLTEKTKYHE